MQQGYLIKRIYNCGEGHFEYLAPSGNVPYYATEDTCNTPSTGRRTECPLPNPYGFTIRCSVYFILHALNPVGG